MPSMLYTYSPGGSALNHNFIRRLPDDCAIETCLSLNQQVVCKIMEQLPVYHTRAMKQEFINHYGLLMRGTKPYVLRSIYRELTKDASCSRTAEEEEVDQRVQEMLSLEDVDIIVDLRELNECREAKYELFWF